jgi:hypothetical protein
MHMRWASDSDVKLVQPSIRHPADVTDGPFQDGESGVGAL